MRIAVVVATYRRESELVNALRSLLPQLGADDELIVVDQTDRHEVATTRFLSTLADRWHQVSPASLPAARNYGIKHTTAEIVLFIDDDVHLDDGFLEAHRAAHAEHPDAAGVVGRIRLTDRIADRAPFRMTWLGVNVGAFDYDGEEQVPSVQGCNMSWKRQALEVVGGFDTRFVGNAYREESELSARALRGGWTIWYTPNAALDHLVASQGGCREDSVYDGELFYRNEFLYQLLSRARWTFPFVVARTWRAAVLTRDVVRDRRVRARMRAVRSGLAQARRASRTTLSLELRRRG
jgi:GT2 family glycosyltransferase